MTGAYRNWYTGSPDYTDEPMNQYAQNQGWWRSPDVAGGLLYNNYYGYQKADDVRNMYTAYGQPMSNEQFTAGNYFTPQTGQDWSQYYPDMNTDAGWQAAGYTWNPDTNQWEQGGGTGSTLDIGGWPTNWDTGTTGADATGGTVADTTQGAFNNYPTQWGTANDILSYFGTGGATDVPGAWLQAQNTYGQMANNGMPTDYTDAYEAAKKAAYYDTDAAIKNSNEQSGLTGTRWSTPLGAQNANIAAKSAAGLGSQFAQQQMTAQEAARQRMLQGAQGLYDVGQGQTGLTESAKNRAMSAASGLSDLGAQYAQLPMTAATTSMNLGNQMQTTGQGTLDKLFTEYMRNAGENNPYLSMIYQMATGQGMPQQYGQGTGSSLLGLLSGLGSLAAKL